MVQVVLHLIWEMLQVLPGMSRIGMKLPISPMIMYSQIIGDSQDSLYVDFSIYIKAYGIQVGSFALGQVDGYLMMQSSGGSREYRIDDLTLMQMGAGRFTARVLMVQGITRSKQGSWLSAYGSEGYGYYSTVYSNVYVGSGSTYYGSGSGGQYADFGPSGSGYYEVYQLCICIRT